MKIPALIISILLIASLAGCGKADQHSSVPTEAPTERLTESPTAEPTAAPTGAPTPEPTEKPDFSGLIPQTGRLCEGPIFPEPAKYLVISGEGDNFYVYDNMGELVKVFKAVEDEYAFGGPGFYGEDGICENVLISTGETLAPFHLFGSCFIFIDEDWENDSFRLKRIADEDLQTLFEFSDEEAPELGIAGGVLKLGDRFLVLEREPIWDFGESETNEDEILILDGKGKTVGRIDPEPFGNIIGVYADKYLISGERIPDGDEDELSYESYGFVCTLYDLDGNMIMDRVYPVFTSSFAIEDEVDIGTLRYADYLRDSDGRYLDSDLKPVESIPEYAPSPTYLRYGNLNWEMEKLGYSAEVWSGVYSGVRLIDEDRRPGEWTFRIYDPKLASDRDNSPWHWWD
ncbi:MAG: PT domain-containing protein [Clostridia bacterium]|nr:PT domain-containing protein [Clostridia bacterium]